MEVVEEQDGTDSELTRPVMAEIRVTRQQSKRMLHRVNEADRGLVKLDFSHLPLYGRFQEKLSVGNTLRRVGVPGASAEVLILFGKAGTGKTALVREALQDIKEPHFRGRGKFESTANGPFATVVDVFAELFMSMIDQMGKDGQDYATAVEEALGDEAYRITHLIPELIDLIGERPPSDEQQQISCDYTAFRRFLNLMRCMLRAVCSFQKLVVLWFDDLQLADPDSLELFKYISNDPGASNLLIVGSFEDRKGSDVTEVMNFLGEAFQVKSTLIQLRNLSQASLTSLLADVMATDVHLSKSLARAVYKRSKGNPFFMIQFLELIQELGLLQFDLKTQLWVWDLKIIADATSVLKTVDTSINKAQFAVLARLSHLPYTSKMILSTAASLGSSKFDIKVLAWLLKDKELTLDEKPSRQRSRRALEARPFMSAMMSSLRGFERLGDPEHEIRETLVALEKIGMVEALDSNVYRFAHDIIQDGAYYLLPDKSKRFEKHWKTGQYLKNLLDKRILEDDRLFFTMVDQLNCGSLITRDEEDHLELSSLNLRAAYKARVRSAFACATKYVHHGVAYLGEKRWKANHFIAMKFEVLRAEVAFSRGDNEDCLNSTQEAIQKGLTLVEKIPFYFLRIQALTLQGHHADALDCAIDALGQCGEKIASKPRAAYVAMNLARSKGLLNVKPDQSLLDAPTITDVSTMTIMQLLALTIRCLSGHISKYNNSLLRCRMFQITVRYGTCEESPIAYTGFGALLATKGMADADAYRIGSLGFQLQQQLNSPKYEARVAFEFFAYTHLLKQPIHHSLGALHKSYKNSLRYGVIEDALMAASLFCYHYIYSGHSLVALVGIMDECISLAKEYMPSLHSSMVAYGQLLENLWSSSPNSLILNGQVMDLEGTLNRIKRNNDVVAHRMLLCAQVENACWFQQYAVANSFLDELAGFPQDETFNATFTARRLVFLDGLVHAELARSLDNPDGNHLRQARERAKTLSNFVQQGAVSCIELSQILEAELLSLDGKTTHVDVTQAFQMAVISAIASGAHQNAGLANELAGRYCSSFQYQDAAMLFLREAHRHYSEWNANVKVKDLEDTFPQLRDELDSSFSPTGPYSRMTTTSTTFNWSTAKSRLETEEVTKNRVSDVSIATTALTSDMPEFDAVESSDEPDVVSQALWTD